MSEKKADLIKENNELRAENNELRRFVNYVRSLKTDEDFLKLKKVLEEADRKFKEKE